MANGGAGLGYKVSVNVSRNKSEHQSTTQASEAVGSSIVGANNVNIVATGGGADSNIRAVGSTIAAGNTVNLAADNAVTLEASKNTYEHHGTNSSSGASIGVGFAGGSQNGFTIDLGVSRGRGKEDASDVSYNNTRVSGGRAVNVTSGGDLTMRGAVIEAPKVTADVGGNLHIESLQDTSHQVSKQNSSGLNVSLCIPPICYGVSTVGGSASGAKANGSFASVSEQSGIKAGDAGFDVDVKGHTDLKGAVISSTQAAIDEKKNSFTTASLTTSDIANHSQSRGSSYAASASVGFAAGDQSTATTDADKRAAANAQTNARPGGSAGVGSTSSNQTSTTTSGISGISGIAGDQSVRTGDNGSAGTLVKDWNTQAIVKDVQAQAQITAEFGQNAAREVGAYANGKIEEAKALSQIEKVRLTLPDPFVFNLQAAIRNERTLDEAWIKTQGWDAFHLDDANLVRFVASTWIRYCRSIGVDELYAVSTVDLFRAIYGKVDARRVPMTLDGISEACFGPPSFSGPEDPSYEWFLQQAWRSSLFFSMVEPIPMLVMRDASTCVTITGEKRFLDCMLKRSKRTWYEGVPYDGLANRGAAQSDA